jgi:hypothetical protein
MEHPNGSTVIALSKIKIFLLFLCSLAFVAGGLWFAVMPPATKYNKYFLMAAGIVSVLFFGMCAVALLAKLFNRESGLIIDDSGITDNSGAFGAGFIPWVDITAVESFVSANQNFILLFVRNPEEYINRNSFFLARKTRSANYKFYGTPLTVSANGLKINFKNLRAVIFAEYAMYLEKNGLLKSEED